MHTSPGRGRRRAPARVAGVGAERASLVHADPFGLNRPPQPVAETPGSVESFPMRILVTGATGFVGSHLVERLARASDHPVGAAGPRVRALIRPSSDLTYLEGLPLETSVGHLEDPASIREAVDDVEVVIHLGALTRARNEEAFRSVNEIGTRTLLQAAADSGSVRRFIYVSSLSAVGPATEGRPVEPHDDPHPLSAYGRSKLAGESACAEYAEAMAICILRPPAVYGPRDVDLLHFFRLARWGILPVPTGPTRWIQLIHVSDLCRAISLSAFADPVTGTYHVAGPTAYTWVEILGLMARACGRKGWTLPVPMTMLRAAGAAGGGIARALGRPTIFDGDKVRELLAPGWLCETQSAERVFGFRASIPLDEGFAETAAWYRMRGWIR